MSIKESNKEGIDIEIFNLARSQAYLSETNTLTKGAIISELPVIDPMKGLSFTTSTYARYIPRNYVEELEYCKLGLKITVMNWDIVVTAPEEWLQNAYRSFIKGKLVEFIESKEVKILFFHKGTQDARDVKK